MLTTFYTQLKDLHKLNCIQALLGWDQQVYMPPGGRSSRTEQLEMLAGISHERLTDPKLIELVEKLWNDRNKFSETDQVNLRETKRVIDRAKKLPADFVMEKSVVESQGFQTWCSAKPKNDFEAVRPILEKLVELNKKEADLVGFDEHPYDAMLDIFEPAAKISVIKPLLSRTAVRLAKMLPQIIDRQKEFKKINRDFPVAKQIELNRRIATAIGFSPENGRIDASAHPFMTNIGPRDMRITTRYDALNYLSSLFSILHEAGHAMYELGFKPEHAGVPMGQAISMGIHESQSRLLENIIGRSREFSEYLYKQLEELFPAEHQRSSPKEIWQACNIVQRSLIRVEADEVTYSIHIVIRMLLEEALFSGNLAVNDLPNAWNELYQEYLGVTPPSVSEGVMQDVHWHQGSFGYFPSYALGNLYGAQMLKMAAKEIDIGATINAGDFAPLVGWLRKNVHEQGKRYAALELIKVISGEDLSEEAFVGYIERKFIKGEEGLDRALCGQ